MCNCKKLYVVTPDSDLYSVDTVTASAAYIGPLNRSSVTDIAAHKGAMYGITFNEFLLVDPNSGSSAVVGPLGLTANALAVAPDGTIYAGSFGDLVTINPSTGAATVVGPFGGGLSSSGDLAFDANGTLYASLNNGLNDVLAQIDPLTGAATPLFSFGLGGAYGLAFCCCGLFVATESGELFKVHVGTASLELVGKIGVKVWGMSCGSCC